MSRHRWGRYCNVAVETGMSCPGTGVSYPGTGGVDSVTQHWRQVMSCPGTGGAFLSASSESIGFIFAPFERGESPLFSSINFRYMKFSQIPSSLRKT